MTVSDLHSVRMLHVSGLPLWSMAKGSGMPSLYETVRGYVDAGCQIDMLLPHANLFSLKPTSAESPWPSVKVHLIRIPGLEVVNLIRLGVRRAVPWSTVHWFVDWFTSVFVCLAVAFAYIRKGLQLRREHRYDVVYAHNEYASLSGYILGKLMRCPNITRLYGTFLGVVMRLPFMGLRYPVAVSAYRIPSDLLIVANDGTRGDKVAERLGIDMSRLRFWQNGVPKMDSDRVRADKPTIAAEFPGLDPSCDWLVMASRLTSWKRIDRAVAAMPEVVRRVPSTQLVLIGDGETRAPLTEQVRRENLGDRVVFVGSQERRNVFRIMSASDCLLMTNDVTNRCNAIFEALRCGLPIVTMDDGTTEGLLENGRDSLLVPRDDVAGLSEAIAGVLSNDELRQELCRGAEKTASSLWTWEERMRTETREVSTLCRRAMTAREVEQCL